MAKEKLPLGRVRPRYLRYEKQTKSLNRINSKIKRLEHWLKISNIGPLLMNSLSKPPKDKLSKYLRKYSPHLIELRKEIKEKDKNYNNLLKGIKLYFKNIIHWLHQLARCFYDEDTTVQRKKLEGAIKTFQELARNNEWLGISQLKLDRAHRTLLGYSGHISKRLSSGDVIDKIEAELRKVFKDIKQLEKIKTGRFNLVNAFEFIEVIKITKNEKLALTKSHIELLNKSSKETLKALLEAYLKENFDKIRVVDSKLKFETIKASLRQKIQLNQDHISKNRLHKQADNIHHFIEKLKNGVKKHGNRRVKGLLEHFMEKEAVLQTVSIELIKKLDRLAQLKSTLKNEKVEVVDDPFLTNFVKGIFKRVFDKVIGRLDPKDVKRDIKKWMKEKEKNLFLKNRVNHLYEVLKKKRKLANSIKALTEQYQYLSERIEDLISEVNKVDDVNEESFNHKKDEWKVGWFLLSLSSIVYNIISVNFSNPENESYVQDVRKVQERWNYIKREYEASGMEEKGKGNLVENIKESYHLVEKYYENSIDFIEDMAIFYDKFLHPESYYDINKRRRRHVIKNLKQHNLLRKELLGEIKKLGKEDWWTKFMG